VIAALLVLAAAYHASAAAFPSLGVSGMRWRHVLFIAIDLAAAALLIFRPRGATIAIAALTVQQLYSHGSYGWLLWRTEGRVDWISLGVMVVLPIALVLLATRSHRRNHDES
jgi:hypothetical protein